MTKVQGNLVGRPCVFAQFVDLVSRMKTGEESENANEVKVVLGLNSQAVCLPGNLLLLDTKVTRM